MPKQTLKVPSLFNGISQQPDSIRFKNQVEDATNVSFSVFDGAQLRPPTIFVSEITGLNPSSTFRLHAIERDSEEQYLAVYGDSTLRVLEADGRESTVTKTSEANSYVNSNNATDDQMRLISITDATFFLNTTVPVSLSAAGDDLDGTTMPIKLTRTVAPTSSTAATFTLDVVDWEERSTGTNDSNPAPSLWQNNSKLSDMSFHRGRLVLAGDENVVFSRAGDILNFYNLAHDNVVDADPIDVQLSSEQVTIVDYITEWNKTLAIFTKSGRQFQLNSPSTLSQDTASITTSTSHKTLSVRPQLLGDTLFFVGSKRGSSVLYELLFDDLRDSNVANDVTGHVPYFLSQSIRSIATGDNSNIVFVLPKKGTGGTLGGTSDINYLLKEDGDFLLTEDGDRIILDEGELSNLIGTYKFHWQGDNKIQSAWSKYEFHSDYMIHDVAKLGNMLYMLVQFNELFILEAMPIEINMDPDSPSGDQFEVAAGKRGGS